MKKTLSVLLFILVLFSGAWADVHQDFAPEYFYTRVIYTGHGRGRIGRGYSRGAPFKGFKCSDLAPGEGGAGDYGGGWMTDYPASDCKFMWGVERLTGIKVYREGPNPLELTDPHIFDFPYLYMVEPGQMSLEQEEADRLREYLMRGGFLHADDFWGLAELDNFLVEMQKVFPDREFKELPLTHEVFHTFFDIDTVMQIPNVNNGCNGGQTWEQPSDIKPRIFGMSDDKGRLMIVVTYNSDLGDAWEHMDVACYPEKFSGQAYRMGVNFIIYAMTH